ncbi:hypothetical protein DFH08DRAFT_808774 [Mycena albidolilacea]|uniref:Uncharacterized protein n=1 Tax=Mycena albidolilacea TaxID=1033008 RepID=A0AAD7A2F4_9AGAR|nr:hypothetical protein DFH08DRAFT_808774 [Mycena albidolilacea]
MIETCRSHCGQFWAGIPPLWFHLMWCADHFPELIMHLWDTRAEKDQTKQEELRIRNARLEPTTDGRRTTPTATTRSGKSEVLGLEIRRLGLQIFETSQVRELYEEPCEDRMVTSVEELTPASEDCGTQCIGQRMVAACGGTRVSTFDSYARQRFSCPVAGAQLVLSWTADLAERPDISQAFHFKFDCLVYNLYKTSKNMRAAQGGSVTKVPPLRGSTGGNFTMPIDCLVYNLYKTSKNMRAAQGGSVTKVPPLRGSTGGNFTVPIFEQFWWPVAESSELQAIFLASHLLDFWADLVAGGRKALALQLCLLKFAQ